MENFWSQLPGEMVEHIMTYLDTSTLLSCRGVSSVFKVIATRLLRLRPVHLDQYWFIKEEGMQIFKLFGKLESTPWSFYKLDKRLNIALETEFFSKLGMLIRSCHVEDDSYKFNTGRMLSLMPNLEEVTLPKYKDILLPTLSENNPLKFLKRIKMTFCGDNAVNVKNLETILNVTTSNLKFVEIRKFRLIDYENLERIATLLSKIPSLFLGLRVIEEEDITGLEKIKLNIRGLKIESSMTIICCDRNIASSLELLEVLHIKLGWDAGANDPFFISLPPMPTVKYLMIKLGNWTSTMWEIESLKLVIRFPTELFPNLCKMSVWSIYGTEIKVVEFTPYGFDLANYKFFGSAEALEMDSWRSGCVLIFQPFAQISYHGN